MKPPEPAMPPARKPDHVHPELVTARLQLRAPRSSDLDALHECFSDPASMQHWNKLVHTTKAETAKSLRWMMKNANPRDHLSWCIDIAANGRCIGMVNYHDRNIRNRQMTIGYIINPAVTRQGYGAEAVNAVVQYGFTTLNAHRIQAFIEPGNDASQALARKIGFTCDGGPLRDAWRVADEFRSVMVYSRLATDP
jgi:ribosomal-protein-alanine N-acetyltransferase